MNDIKKPEFIWPVRVYYEDTDVAGVVYYANYLKFYERGRTEWLRSLGYDQDLLIEQGLAFAVAHIDARYFAPARFNEKLLVKTTIVKSRKASVVFHQQIVSDDAEQKLLNEATIKVACVDVNTMIPTSMPDYLVEEIASDWC
ncbi:tol-pal system-associated acyl-CoA thioesterase [Kangiella sp. TOML190]|uniref:tol-pal system-associated acyl-CoA thioesterase n=1 Tax=Kangiella sp. TOML190 TaxID=2931351 RepID=UPI00203A780B|nr:tol-pal system-associated acyl-CoA thioesterase [Kangiella sp. TOML190]